MAAGLTYERLAFRYCRGIAQHDDGRKLWRIVITLRIWWGKFGELQ